MRINQAVENQLATVKNWGFAKSKDKGTLYLWIDFTFDHIEGDNGEELTVKATLYLTEGTIEYVLEKLQNLGWAGTNIFELDKSEGGSYYDLAGAKGLLTVAMESYNGKMYPRVQFINDPNYTPDQPVNKSEVKQISDKLRAKILAIRQRSGNGPIKPNTKEAGETTGQKEPVFGEKDKEPEIGF